MVWMDALANTYVAEQCGVMYGAGYKEVLKWLPSLRPYPTSQPDDAIYAVTHLVYTLNDYGAHQLSPRRFPKEFAFLKANVAYACEQRDPELLGELLDSLKAFGLDDRNPLIMQGTKYLLEEQNKDGSWGDAHEENIRTRCHTTWTAIDGLRSYAWQEPRVSRS